MQEFDQLLITCGKFYVNRSNANKAALFRDYLIARDAKQKETNQMTDKIKELENRIIALEALMCEPVTKISVDWSLLPKWAKWIAMNSNGDILCFEDRPILHHYIWFIVSRGKMLKITDFPFVSAGTCDWKDSLVERLDDD